MYRPILLGRGPNSLIDRIDAQDLIKKGQKDALDHVQFARCEKTAVVEWSATYAARPVRISQRTAEENLACGLILRFLFRLFIIIGPVDAIYYGTSLSRLSTKPRLRIFSNQEAEELKNEHDFMGAAFFLGQIEV